jgi:hypothetical protein
MCLRRAPEKYIAGAALDRAVLNGMKVLQQPGTFCVEMRVATAAYLPGCDIGGSVSSLM